MAHAFFCRPIARVDGAIYLPKQGNTNKFLNMIALLKKLALLEAITYIMVLVLLSLLLEYNC